VKVDGVDVGCIYHDYRSVMQWLHMSVFVCIVYASMSYIYCYAYINMGVVVMLGVIVCRRYG